ncbi:MAG TPA: BON domain-containing protein [Bryobacteraceae bacterium]|nr:BON domain-containing protein [Bryobacteraceae bacterium]
MRLLVFFLLFLALGCAAPALAKSDAAIEAEIRARLSRSKIAVNGFNVRVQNGTAIWTGKTGIIQHKGAATRMAKSAGALKVDNRIAIDERAKEKAAARLRAPRTERKNSDDTQKPAAERTPEPRATALAPPPVRRAIVKTP